MVSLALLAVVPQLTILAYTDTVRRSHIRERHKRLHSTLSALPGGHPDEHALATEAEREALKQRSVTPSWSGTAS